MAIAITTPPGPPAGAVVPTGELVAVVEDDPTTRRLVRAWLEGAGYSVVEYDSARAVKDAIGPQPNAACIDLHLGGESNGFDVMSFLRERDPELPTIVVTADGDVQTAVAAMRAGAYDYLTKPIDRDCLLLSVRRACERRRLVDRVKNLQTALGSGLFESIVGSSPAMRELSQQVERVLESDVAVCLQGESGTGKELIARAIHQGGPRRRGPFVAINCAAIPTSLQESELFGHERGAFTGATQTRLGCFERARGGTLLLDEVGEMSPAVQAVLLRTLQERTVRRVGGSQEIPTDVRIVCATHRDLRSEVDAGRFREDLYFRLVVYPIRLPALRDRTEDIPLLIAHFLEKLRARSPHAVRHVAPDALEALGRHAWPGNVRELENVVHRCVLAARSNQIELADLPPDLQSAAAAPGSRPVALDEEADSGTIVPLRELEERAIRNALRVTRGSVGRAAKLLGIGRATLYRRIAEIDNPISVRENAS